MTQRDPDTCMFAEGFHCYLSCSWPNGGMTLLVPGACLHGECSLERDWVIARAFPRELGANMK